VKIERVKIERGNFGGQGLMKKLFRSVSNRVAGAVAVTGLLLIPLGVFGGSAFGHSGAAQYQYRVTICHHTGSKKHPWHLITISNKAVPAHLRHHDVLPPCPTTLTVAKNHGKSGDHGKPSSAGSQSQSTSGSQSHKDDDHGNGKDNGHHGKP
jgi:hypothetical protein